MPMVTNVPVAADDPPASSPELTTSRRAGIIGPDAALAAGVADACIAAGIAVFGPTASAARIESSKVFAKTVMDTPESPPRAGWRQAGGSPPPLNLVADLGGRCVVKADGLALGKGVMVCDDVGQAEAAWPPALTSIASGPPATRCSSKSGWWDRR